MHPSDRIASQAPRIRVHSRGSRQQQTGAHQHLLGSWGGTKQEVRDAPVSPVTWRGIQRQRGQRAPCSPHAAPPSTACTRASWKRLLEQQGLRQQLSLHSACQPITEPAVDAPSKSMASRCCCPIYHVLAVPSRQRTAGKAIVKTKQHTPWQGPLS